MALLGLVIISFGFRVYTQRDTMKRHAPEIFGATILSALFSLFSTAFAAKAIGLSSGEFACSGLGGWVHLRVGDQVAGTYVLCLLTAGLIAKCLARSPGCAAVPARLLYKCYDCVIVHCPPVCSVMLTAPCVLCWQRWRAPWCLAVSPWRWRCPSLRAWRHRWPSQPQQCCCRWVTDGGWGSRTQEQW